MPKKILIFLIIMALPFLLMGFINEMINVPKRTNNYTQEDCSWYCHNVTCKHWKKSYNQDPTKLKLMHKKIFDWYVNSLHDNKLGLNYSNINLLVFLIVYPSIGGLLLWNLVRKIK